MQLNTEMATEAAHLQYIRVPLPTLMDSQVIHQQYAKRKCQQSGVGVCAAYTDILTHVCNSLGIATYYISLNKALQLSNPFRDNQQEFNSILFI